MALAEETLQRVNRVLAFHASTKHTYESVRAGGAPLDWSTQPQRYRDFPDAPQTPLSTSILDITAGTLAIIEEGLQAVPESLLRPPQELKTLSTWLYLAYGRTHKDVGPGGEYWLRTCPSIGDLFPAEIYVAAFAVDGLEPGLYHYSPRNLTLARLRKGPEVLAVLKRGRPDLEFLKQVPAALLVSAIFCRSAWRYRERGYRCALADVGSVVQNLVAVGTGLGIQTLARLRVSESATRELIGVPPDAPFAEAESVLGMVIWADKAARPLEAEVCSPQPLPPLARQPLAPVIEPIPSILAVHADAVGGMGIRQVRPPLTELDPLPEDFPITHLPADDKPEAGRPLRDLLLKWRQAADFVERTISRDEFSRINRVAFRSGTHFPILPGGPHTGLVRAFWIVNSVVGIENGAWYYDAATDTWSVLRLGVFRKEAAYLALEQPLAGRAAAVCFMMVNLQVLMSQVGPDVYVAAHLEAGLAAQRIQLAAAALGLGARGISGYYDDEVKAFMGLERSGWEPLYGIAIGVPAAVVPSRSGVPPWVGQRKS
jgi:SagB-type dehydrogenase family enzyme